MLNLNKTNRSLKGIALILALVTVLALCLVGCTDQEARDAAQEAKDKAAAAVTQTQLTSAIEEALKGVETVTLEQVNTVVAEALAAYTKTEDLTLLTEEDVKKIVADATKDFKSCTCTPVAACTCEIKTKAEVQALIAASINTVAATLEQKANELQGQITSNNSSLADVAIDLDTMKTNITKMYAELQGALEDLADVKDALADFAKASDLADTDAAVEAIQAVLGAKADVTDVTNLDAKYGIEIGKVNDAIAALESKLGTDVGSASTALDTKIDDVKAELEAAIADLENRVIVLEIWDANTPEVIKLCAELSKILTTKDYKFGETTYTFANDKEWYGDKWNTLEAIVDGARIELIRSYNAKNCLEDVLTRLSAVTTIMDEDATLENLLNSIPFPVALDNAADIAAVRASYNTEYARLEGLYGAALVEKYVAEATMFNANTEVLPYAEAKIAALNTQLAKVDGMIKEYAVNNLDVVYEEWLQTGTAPDGTAIMGWVTTMTEDDAGMIKHIKEDVLKHVGTNDIDVLGDIVDEYAYFLGTACTLNDEAKAAIVAKGKDAASILAADTFMNVADAYEGTTDTLFVYFYPAVDVYNVRCYENNFKALKALMSVSDVLGYMQTLVDTNDVKYEDDLTAIGTAFANVIDEYVLWKVQEGVNSTFAGSNHYLTFNPNYRTVLSVVDNSIVEVQYNFYPGADWSKMLEVTEAHFDLIIGAEKAVVNFSGYKEIIDDYLALADADKADYVAKVTDEAFIKEVIDMAFRAIDPNVIADAAEKLFNNYKIQAVNKIALMTDDFVTALDAEVAAGTLSEDVAERMTKAANIIEIAYINEILNMNYADYNYTAKSVNESKAKVYTHFAGIVGSLEARDADLDAMIANGELATVADDASVYGVVLADLSAKTGTEILAYADTTATAAGSKIAACNK